MKRFAYHFEPKSGWMNDPNGLCCFQGKYHAFFQHNPHDIKWGPMHWGHAVSEDLLHWEELPIALYPDMEYENDGGCFSGSAIVHEGKLYLIYTSVSKKYGQAQSVAVSEDGIHFTKYEKNPVITHFPADGSADFRDPKVFGYHGEYRMVVGTVYNKKGRVLQYRSKDLLNWEYMGVLYESCEYNHVIECPDLFCVDDTWVLMFSKIGQDSHQEQFITGDYDGNRFIPGQYFSTEAGPQFYAAQTFEDSVGRRILIGWFYDWRRTAEPGDEAAGALTIPRILQVRDGKLFLYPVAEAEPLLKQLSFGEYEFGPYCVKIMQDAVSIENKDWENPLTYQGCILRADALWDEKGLELFVNGGEANFSVR